MAAILIQIDAYDPVAAAAVTLRIASDNDDLLCHLNGQTWWPALQAAPVFSYDYFDGAFGNRIEAPSSSLSVSIDPWPNFARYSFGDARVQIWTGTLGAPWGSFTLRFDGRVTAQPEIVQGIAAIPFAVDDRWLDTPLLTPLLGTGGVEGPAEMKGTPRPLMLGRPRYAPGLMVDSVNNVLMLSGYGLIEDVETALEALARFGASSGDHASYAALIAASVPPGGWATCKAEGLVRHGAPPAGKLSYLVKGDKAGPDGWARMPGQLIRRIALLSGGSGKISDAALNALDAARPYNVSLVVTDQTTARDLIQQIAASVNAVAGVSWLGKLWARPVGIGSSARTLASDGSSLPPVAKVDQVAVAVPFWRLAIEAEKTWAVHDQSEVFYVEPADPNATVDLTLTAIGTAPPLIQGNKVTNNSGAHSYETMVRGPALAGACFAECDIVSGANYTSIALDGSATDKASNNQDLLAEYLSSSGGLQIFRGASSIISTTIATGLAGKLQAAYDGVRYRVFVAGTEYAASSVTYPGMIAASAPLAHYPKWTPYTLGSTLTGLRAGPFTDNNFGSMGGNGTPDPYATGSDNLIANASLAADASQWAFFGVNRVVSSAGQVAPAYIEFPIGTSYCECNNSAKIPILGATKLYASGYLQKGVGNTGGTLYLNFFWYRADGSPSAITTVSSPVITPPSTSLTLFNISVTPPSDAASVKVQPSAGSVTGSVFALSGLRVAKTEPAADVTSTAKVAVEMAADKAVAAAYDGTVSSTDLGALRWSPKVTKGGVSIKGENATTYALSNTYGGTFAVDNTNGSSTKGDITQSAITANTAGGELTITVNGVAEPKIAFKVTKSIAAPPPATGGGSTKTISWMDGDWNGLNTTSYSTVNALKSIAVASGETLYVSGILDINVAGTAGVTRTMTLKVQYSATGANSWNDFPGGGHVSSTATAGISSGPPDYDYTEPMPGSVTMTDSKTGLSAATYDVRVVGICSATGNVCTPSGTLTVEARV